jgi:SAM-dependent methyltransferase
VTFVALIAWCPVGEGWCDSMDKRVEAGGGSRCSSFAKPPYSGLAWVYDDIVGDAMFPLIRRNVEQAIRRYRITFSSVADLGCGTGSFIHYLQRFGVPVIGVDRSAQMLQVAAMKCGPGSGISFLQQEIARFRLPCPVDLITCNFDTLNYILKTDELFEVFKRVNFNLTTAGHFIFDILCPIRDEEKLHAAVQEIRLPRFRGKWTTYWNPQKHRTVVYMVHLFKRSKTGWTRMEEVHRQRWYHSKLICDLIGKAGFRPRGAHEAQTFKPATSHTHWVKWIAQKI